MEKHILLPVGLSDPYEAIIDVVRDLSVPEETQLTLLHVIETLQDVPFEEMEDFYADLRARAEDRLAEWAGALRGICRQVVCEVVYGDRATEIVQFADENDVGLVVLRSRTFDRERPTDTFGTLSHQVALVAPCSVLLVR